MRIGVNCFLLQAHIGGLKQYFINLFDWLLQNDSDNTYVLFHFAHNSAELERLKSARWRDDAVLLTDQSEIAEHVAGLDLYFCPFGVLWPRSLPVPTVVTLVDIQEVFYPQFFTPGDLFSRALYFPASTRAADRVVTISEFSKSTIAEHHHLDPGKIVVAYLCADAAYLESGGDTSQVELPFSRFVFFPANRWPHKNHDVLLRALRILSAHGETVPAVFTGFDMPNGYPLLDKAREYGVSDLIFAPGYVNVAQMAWLFRSAEMLVFPSLFEGFGMPPVEAMASGCPVVASTSTCLPEICGDAAEYFDPLSAEALADAISTVWKNRLKRDTLIERGRIRARTFSAERMSQAHLRAFREAVEAFSWSRYWWQRLAYQPYHLARTHARRALHRFDAVSAENSACRIGFSRGWSFVEQSGSDWLRWSSGEGCLLASARGPLRMRVEGQLASLQRPNEVRVSVNGRAVWEQAIDGEFCFKDFAVSIDLAAGKNVLEFVSKRPGIVASPNDSRRLAIAVRNLRFLNEDNTVRFRLDQ